MAKKCEVKIEDKTCGKKAVKTYRNSATDEKKVFCEEHGPWVLPYSDGVWEKVEETKS